jgi:hypothetical protein
LMVQMYSYICCSPGSRSDSLCFLNPLYIKKDRVR